MRWCGIHTWSGLEERLAGHGVRLWLSMFVELSIAQLLLLDLVLWYLCSSFNGCLAARIEVCSSRRLYNVTVHDVGLKREKQLACSWQAMQDESKPTPPHVYMLPISFGRLTPNGRPVRV